MATESELGVGSNKYAESKGISSKVAAIPDLPFFGTTTSAKRMDNKSLNGYNEDGHSHRMKAPTPGQRFLRLKGRIPEIIRRNGRTCGDKERDICINVFDSAIERRLKFEISLEELERLARAEAQRLQTEERMNMKGTELKGFLADYNKKIMQTEKVDEVDDKGVDSDGVAVMKEAIDDDVADTEDPLAELLR